MINASLDRCFSFINSQTTPSAKPATAVVRRALTISRMAGCGAVHVAEKLANYLQEHAPTPGVKWTIFDRQLMAKVLEDHNLPRHLEKILPEDRASRVQYLLADIFNVHPSENTMLKLIAETILQLAELGNVIIVGRGANIVTAKLPHWTTALSASPEMTTRPWTRRGVLCRRKTRRAPVTSRLT
jgi:hypothetical protein